MPNKRFISPQEVQEAAKALTRELHPGAGTRFYGVPRGGVPAAFAVASVCNGVVVNTPQEATYIIDDIWDSGRTAERHALYGKTFRVLFDKRLPQWAGQWLVMPWEAKETQPTSGLSFLGTSGMSFLGTDDSATDIVTRLLQYIGEDPNREGLRETPKRFLQGWTEWASGYGDDPASILKCFEDGARGVDEMVIVHNIPVISKCEHHLADIVGIAHVGYIPNGRIVGLSKLARLVECFARRLQVQERMTNQIAEALQTHVSPLGIGVLIRAAHHCMLTRGVKVHGSVTTTSAMRGALLEKPEARAEFMALCAAAER